MRTCVWGCDVRWGGEPPRGGSTGRPPRRPLRARSLGAVPVCSEWTSGGPRRPDGFPRAPVAPAARRSRPRRSGSWLCLPSSLSRVWAAPAPGPPAAYSIPRVTWPPGLLQVSGGDGARRSGCGMAESPGTATALRPAGRVRSAKPFQRDEEGFPALPVTQA